MAWFSLLPENLSIIETWVARIFFLLGVITIGPWAALLIYDFFLYIWRSIMYEIPLVGGRAQGRARPRAPSLTERPSGSRRRFSLASPTSRNGTTTSSRPEYLDKDRIELTRRKFEND